MDDLPVWSPDEIALRHTDIPVLVASTVYDSAITEMLCRKGCTAVIPVAVLNLLLPDVFVSREHFRSLDAVANPANHDAIRRVYDSLDDEESRRVYTTKLLFYLTQEKALLDGILSEHPIYFEPNIVSISPEEVMVDGGAYTGDTLRDFLSFCENSFGSYYAFEPDPANFSQLAATYEVDGVRVIAVQAGLANRSGRLRFQSGLSMASKLVSDADAGEETIEVVSLDEFFTDRPAPTFIKMDIEGSERGALQGCSNIVARHQPKLAISAYHHAWDLWELPLLLLSMNPHYRLQLRHYTREIADTVCYAIPA